MTNTLSKMSLMSRLSVVGVLAFFVMLVIVAVGHALGAW